MPIFLACEFIEYLGNEFGPVIAPDNQWCSTIANDVLHGLDYFLPRDGRIGDVEAFQHSGVTGVIELEIQFPQMIRACSAKPLRRDHELPDPCTLTFLKPDPQGELIIGRKRETQTLH